MGLSFPSAPKSIGRGPSAKTSPTSEVLSTSSKLCPTFSLIEEDKRRTRDAGRLISLSCGICLGVSFILGSIEGESLHLAGLKRLRSKLNGSNAGESGSDHGVYIRLYCRCRRDPNWRCSTFPRGEQPAELWLHHSF